MMKVLALCFLFTSLVSAGFFTPSPEKRDDVIVKDEHRGVVIELEKDDGNTKVLISPQNTQDAHGVDGKGYVTDAKEKLSGKMEEAKEKIKEASSSVLPEVGKEGDSAHQQEEEENYHKFRPRELVCDAYGKCKHKIASYVGKTKEAVAETAHEAAEKVYAMEEGAKETVSETIGKVQDTVTHTAHMASDKAQEMKESVKDTASEVPRKATEKASETKESLTDAASEVRKKATEKSSEMRKGAKRVVDDAIHTTKKAKEEGEREVREKAKGAEELAGSASERAKQGVKEKGKKGLSGILQRVSNILSSLVRVGSVAGVLHLLGFATAYGMSVWVTFASSYVLAGTLPRQQFAMAQSKIYPMYFKAMATSVGMALVGHLLGRGKRFSPLSLMASLAMILGNMLYLEPRATKVMFERMKKEKEEGHATEPSTRVMDPATETAAGRYTSGGRATATAEEASQEKQEIAAAKPRVTKSRDTLRRLNSYSSLLNVAALMSLTWHLVRLGQHIYSAC